MGKTRKCETPEDRKARTARLGRLMDRAEKSGDLEACDAYFEPWLSALMAEHEAGDHGESVLFTTRTTRRKAS